MSVLQALEGYYHRLDERGEVSAPGWSPEKFGWCVVLDHDGVPVDVQDLHDLSGKKSVVKLYRVPASFPRPGVTPRAFFLWDKTAFALGVTKPKGAETWVRADKQHAAFVDLHLARLATQDDEGLVALRRFLESWRPERFGEAPFRPEMLDGNVMFRLEGELRFLHERPAARALVNAEDEDAREAGDESGLCLVTGQTAKLARLHPTIKGVEGGQSSGAALVSFNLDAFTSLGKEQGANAPTSEVAAFRYGAALNHLLTRDGPNRLRRPVGDATVVFWADASDAKAADEADSLIADWLGGDVTDDAAEAAQVRAQMEAVAAGRPLAELNPKIEAGTRFHVLGLSPNAARLSVRFWLTDSLDAFAQRLARHHQDCRVEPPPMGWGVAPSVNRLLVNATALQRDFKNIPPLLAGEVMRGVLSGARYPQSLLSAALIRLRAGDNAASGWHAAAIRAVLVRMNRRNPEIPEKGEMPMSLDREHRTPGYLLGRLFAVYELAQRAALGRVNATIRDKYFGAASATPASVFPLIVRGGQNHLAKVRKDKPGWGALIERELEDIHAGLEPSLPRSLGLQQQGEFAIGYYHQRAAKLSNDKGDEVHVDTLSETTDIEGAE